MTRRYAKNLASIWLMTDERVDAETLLRAAGKLPRGKAGIIFRHYRSTVSERRALFDRMLALSRRRRLLLLLAGSARQAQSWRADGWHGPDQDKRSRPMLHSMAAHNARELVSAGNAGADLIFLSPLFATRSHPGSRVLGRVRFAALTRRAAAPVIALGGLRPEHGPKLRDIGASGWGAIDGLSG